MRTTFLTLLVAAVAVCAPLRGGDKPPPANHAVTGQHRAEGSVSSIAQDLELMADFKGFQDAYSLVASHDTGPTTRAEWNEYDKTVSMLARLYQVYAADKKEKKEAIVGFPKFVSNVLAEPAYNKLPTAVHEILLNLAEKRNEKVGTLYKALEEPPTEARPKNDVNRVVAEHEVARRLELTTWLTNNLKMDEKKALFLAEQIIDAHRLGKDSAKELSALVVPQLKFLDKLALKKFQEDIISGRHKEPDDFRTLQEIFHMAIQAEAIIREGGRLDDPEHPVKIEPLPQDNAEAKADTTPRGAHGAGKDLDDVVTPRPKLKEVPPTVNWMHTPEGKDKYVDKHQKKSDELVEKVVKPFYLELKKMVDVKMEKGKLTITRKDGPEADAARVAFKRTYGKDLPQWIRQMRFTKLPATADENPWKLEIPSVGSLILTAISDKTADGKLSVDFNPNAPKPKGPAPKGGQQPSPSQFVFNPGQDPLAIARAFHGWDTDNGARREGQARSMGDMSPPGTNSGLAGPPGNNPGGPGNNGTPKGNPDPNAPPGKHNAGAEKDKNGNPLAGRPTATPTDLPSVPSLASLSGNHEGGKRSPFDSFDTVARHPVGDTGTITPTTSADEQVAGLFQGGKTGNDRNRGTAPVSLRGQIRGPALSPVPDPSITTPPLEPPIRIVLNLPVAPPIGVPYFKAQAFAPQPFNFKMPSPLPNRAEKKEASLFNRTLPRPYATGASAKSRGVTSEVESSVEVDQKSGKPAKLIATITDRDKKGRIVRKTTKVTVLNPRSQQPIRTIQTSTEIDPDMGVPTQTTQTVTELNEETGKPTLVTLTVQDIDPSSVKDVNDPRTWIVTKLTKTVQTMDNDGVTPTEEHETIAVFHPTFRKAAERTEVAVTTWDPATKAPSQRTSTITVMDPRTGAVLSTETHTHFKGDPALARGVAVTAVDQNKL